MSAEKIQDALNLLPDDLLLETDALRQQKQKKPLVLKRLLPVAACFVLVVGTLLITAPWLNRKSAESAMDQMAAAEAPMEYGQPESDIIYSNGQFPDRELGEPNAAMGQENTGNPEEEKTRLDILLVAPPELTVRWDDQNVTVKSETYIWEYLDQKVELSGSFCPGSKWGGEITLTTDAEALELVWGDFPPDTVTATCYSSARSSETWDVEFPAELEENVLTLNPECEIYVITASWAHNGSWGGEATYAIYVQHPE